MESFVNIGLTPLDAVALAYFSFIWVGYALYSDYRLRTGKDSILVVMNRHRQRWMRNMIMRENRLSDTNAVGNIARSISFFASTTVLIVVALLSAFARPEMVREVFESLPFAHNASTLAWECKLLLLTILFIYAFFKYTWSLRQYNYVNILIGAAPGAHEHLEAHEGYARMTAELIGNAARHFGNGLRAYYFSMAVFGWFIHPVAFIIATTLVTMVVYRRDFQSRTLHTIRMDELF